MNEKRSGMKIVKQLCLHRKISFADMASLLDISHAYAVLACGNCKGWDRERLAIADFFGYATWAEMVQCNSEKNRQALFAQAGSEPQRTIISQLGTTIFYEYEGCWYLERVFFCKFERQQFFNRKEAEDAFFSEEIRLLAWGIIA